MPTAPKYAEEAEGTKNESQEVVGEEPVKEGEEVVSEEEQLISTLLLKKMLTHFFLVKIFLKNSKKKQRQSLKHPSMLKLLISKIN